MSYYDPLHDDQFDVTPSLELEEGYLPKALPPQRRFIDTVYNLISLAFLAATIGVIAFVVLLATNPYTPYNPLPPEAPYPTPTLLPLLPAQAADNPVLPTVTPVQPTPTEPLYTVTPEATPTMTSTPDIAETPAGDIPDETDIIPDDSPGGAYPFILQSESITYLKRQNNCEGAWIAGQVTGLNDEPVTGLPVLVSGDNFQAIEVTGNAPAYGISGFEVRVATSFVAAEFKVSLVDPTTGKPLSASVVVRTRSSCEESVAVVNFVQAGDY